VILQNEDWLDPLCACYPVEALEPLRMLVEGGENKLQRLAARLAEEGLLAIRRLTPSESAEMFNMNTPADLTLLAETLDATRNP
jgi:molybdopterin-guanine dinucleotide biosynthesis protein A